MSYRPGTNPIQDAVGNDADGLSNEQTAAKCVSTAVPSSGLRSDEQNSGYDDAGGVVDHERRDAPDEGLFHGDDHFLGRGDGTHGGGANASSSGATPHSGRAAAGHGTGSNFTGTGAGYTLDIEPNANIEGDVTVRVPANAAVDGANNGNVRSPTFR